MNNNDRGMKIKKLLDESVKVGSRVHLGFGTKGGAGFNGTVTQIKGDKVRIKSDEKDRYGHKEYEGLMKNVTVIKEAVDQDHLKKIYDGLNKGDEVTIQYGNSFSRDNNSKFKVTKGKTVVGASRVERITLVHASNPKGVKSYLYNRNGKIYFAIGDSAAIIHSISEAAPPGFEGTVKAMKKHKEIGNEYALAWWMKNKGYKSHKNKDGSDKRKSTNESTVNEESVDTYSTGQDTFAGYPVFTVSGQEYSNCIDGRKKHERWSKRLNMNNETSSAIRRYSHKNPGKPIVIRNEDTGEMIFLRRKNPN